MSKRAATRASWISEVAADAKRIVENSPPQEQEALMRISASARFKKGVVIKVSKSKSPIRA